MLLDATSVLLDNAATAIRAAGRPLTAEEIFPPRELHTLVMLSALVNLMLDGADLSPLCYDRESMTYTLAPEPDVIPASVVPGFPANG